MTKMFGLGAVIGLAMAAGVAQAAPVLHFENTGPSGGMVTYDGAGGAAIGSGIQFDNIIGQDTPANGGTANQLACSNCFLSFSTGGNLTEGGTTWTFAGGGTFQLIGGVAALGIADGSVLLTGTFGSAALTDFGIMAIFGGAGIDDKDDRIVSYFGIDPLSPFNFGTTEIGGSFSTTAGAGFTLNVTDADLVNTVPEPAMLGLLGLGLIGLAAARRRKQAA